jgi:hypothetical protein
MPRSVSFNVTYDAGGDVLYITSRIDSRTRMVEGDYGLVWRYGSGGDPIGVTVIDFREIWSDRPEELAHQLADRFDIPEPQALNVVEHALGTDQ